MRKIILHFAVTADGMVSNVEQWVSLTDEALKDGSAWHVLEPGHRLLEVCAIFDAQQLRISPGEFHLAMR